MPFILGGKWAVNMDSVVRSGSGQRLVPVDHYLVSQTDLQGNITYCNAEFLALSGYTQQELMGRSHGIIRHPDMPDAVFRDLWQTIRQGLPWRGIVKNRCKNGDHYWVDSLIVPLISDDRQIGYMSVRCAPSQADIQKAEELYARLRNGNGQISSMPPWYRRITLRARVIAMLAVMSIIVLVGTYVGVQGEITMGTNVERAYEAHLKPIQIAARMVEQTSDNRAQVMLALQHSPDNPYHNQHDHAVTMHLDAMRNGIATIEQLRSQLQDSVLDAQAQPLMSAFLSSLRQLSDDGIAPALAAMSVQDFDGAQRLLLGRVNPMYKDMSAKATALRTMLEQQGVEARRDASAQLRQLLIISTVGGGMGLLVTLVLGIWLSHSISSKMQRMMSYLRRIGQGDLSQTIPIDDHDEIGKALMELAGMQANLRASVAVAGAIAQGNLSEQVARRSERDMLGQALESMVRRLRSVVGDVVRGAASVASGSQQLSAGAEQLSQGATYQASCAEQASSAMTQISGSIRQTAENAETTAKLSKESASAAAESGQAVSQTINAMKTIASKISIVQEIARQTDMLALNAAVEAARAGQHGRGFAVVASEVRKLAERSEHAALDISRLSDSTVEVADKAGEMLRHLVPNIQRTAELVEEISAACREQDVGADQISTAIQQLDKIIQQNAAAAEEMSATSEELASQASNLQTGVEFFQV